MVCTGMFLHEHKDGLSFSSRKNLLFEICDGLSLCVVSFAIDDLSGLFANPHNWILKYVVLVILFLEKQSQHLFVSLEQRRTNQVDFLLLAVTQCCKATLDLVIFIHSPEISVHDLISFIKDENAVISDMANNILCGRCNVKGIDH